MRDSQFRRVSPLYGRCKKAIFKVFSYFITVDRTEEGEAE